VSKADRKRRVDGLLASFGLTDQADTIIGTPVRKGLSGGQKRRVGIASQLITCPKILFLDEPTSGLDSAASFEVMNYLRTVVKKSKIIVIASIHQPSTSTFTLFDSLYLLSRGKLCYGGPIPLAQYYFEALGYRMPVHVNPAEFFLDLINVDFSSDRDAANRRLDNIHAAWAVSSQKAARSCGLPEDEKKAAGVRMTKLSGRSKMLVPFTLLHRNWVKSYRDVIAYGVRIAMYMGLAVMMGTVWLRLSATQADIQPFINSIFFGSAFMSFMAVAYVPAFLEDRATFVKERANGLYGPAAFMVANFLIGLPYLLLISVLFSVVTYWLCNFRPDATAFFTWIMWLFLDLLAAESLVVFVSCLFPVFVIALALAAFANGLWMSVGGFLVSPKVLNVFWKYWARYIDYHYVSLSIPTHPFPDSLRNPSAKFSQQILRFPRHDGK
jgi:energy-coupling factor transporter ATP-binding protein EcfA2